MKMRSRCYRGDLARWLESGKENPEVVREAALPGVGEGLGSIRGCREAAARA